MKVRQDTHALQHYVPQLLLRGFASARSLLYVFDKQSGRSFRSSVQRAGCEHGFYEHPDSRPDVDDWMKQAETEAGAVIVDIRRRMEVRHLSKANREWLAAFTAIQMVRTKRHLTSEADLSEVLADVLRARGMDPGQVQGFTQLDADQLRGHFIDGIASTSWKLFPYLADKSITLFVTDRKNPFWISDHPVVRDNTLNPGDGLRGTLGLACKGIEIYLPISSQLILGFLCTSIQDYFQEARNLAVGPPIPAPAREVLSAMASGEPLRAQPINVMYFNSLQVSQSERYLFAADNNFALAEDMIKDDPRFKRGPKPEVVGHKPKAI